MDAAHSLRRSFSSIEEKHQVHGSDGSVCYLGSLSFLSKVWFYHEEQRTNSIPKVHLLPFSCDALPVGDTEDSVWGECCTPLSLQEGSFPGHAEWKYRLSSRSTKARSTTCTSINDLSQSHRMDWIKKDL